MAEWRPSGSASSGRDTRRRNGSPDRVAFELSVRWDGDLRVTGSTDGTPENGSVQEASGGLFGARCKDPASKHLAPPLISPSDLTVSTDPLSIGGHAPAGRRGVVVAETKKARRVSHPLGGFRAGPVVRKDPRPCTWRSVDIRALEQVSTIFWGDLNCTRKMLTAGFVATKCMGRSATSKRTQRRFLRDRRNQAQDGSLGDILLENGFAVSRSADWLPDRGVQRWPSSRRSNR